MAEAFKMLEAYIQLSTRGFSTVRQRLLRLKALTTNLHGTIVLDLDDKGAISKVAAVGKEVKDILTTASGLGGRNVSPLTGFVKQFQQNISDVKTSLRQSGISREIQRSFGVDTIIDDYRKSFNDLRTVFDQAIGEKDFAGAKAALKSMKELGQAFRQQGTDLRKEAALRQTLVTQGQKQRQEETKATQQRLKEARQEFTAIRNHELRKARERKAALDKYLADTRRTFAAIRNHERQAARQRSASDRGDNKQAITGLRGFSTEALKRASDALRRFKSDISGVGISKDLARKLDITAVAGVFKSQLDSMRLKLRQALAAGNDVQANQLLDAIQKLTEAFKDNARDVTKAAQAMASYESQQDRVAEASTKLSNTLGRLGNVSSLGRLGNSLGAAAKGISNFGSITKGATGIIGSLGGIARSLGALTTVAGVAAPVLIGVGLAVSALGVAFSAIGAVVSFAVTVLSGVVSVAFSVARGILSLGKALVSATANFVSFTARALKPAASALLDFVFPVRSLIRLLGDIRRRLGPFIASFLAFQGLRAVASDVAAFEQSLVRAATLAEDASTSFFRAFRTLSTAAEDTAARTRFSTGQVATALETLARSGLKTQAAIDTLEPVLALATLSNTDAANATAIFTRTLSGFALNARDAAKVMDGLVGATRQAPIELEETGTALSRAAATSRLFGLNLNDTLAILTRFGQVGIRGERAATALTRGLEKLVEPTKKVQEAIAETLAPQGKGIFDFFTREGELKNGTQSLLDLVDAFNKAVKAGQLTNSNRTEIFGARGREFINLFIDRVDANTGQSIKARDELLRILGEIEQAQVKNISKVAVDRESAGFTALAERLKGLFTRLGQSFVKFFGADLRAALFNIVAGLERFIIVLEKVPAAAKFFATLRTRFYEIIAAIRPLLGYILRLNVFLSSGLLLAISELAKRIAGPFLRALQSAIGVLTRFLGLGSGAFLNNWKSTFAVISFLAQNMSVIFDIAINRMVATIQKIRFAFVNVLGISLNYVQAFGNALLNGISAAINGMTNLLLNGISSIIPSLEVNWTALFVGMAKRIVLEAIRGALNLGGNAIQAIGELTGVDFLKGLGKKLKLGDHAFKFLGLNMLPDPRDIEARMRVGVAGASASLQNALLKALDGMNEGFRTAGGYLERSAFNASAEVQRASQNLAILQGRLQPLKAQDFQVPQRVQIEFDNVERDLARALASSRTLDSSPERQELLRQQLGYLQTTANNTGYLGRQQLQTLQGIHKEIRGVGALK